MSRRIKAESLSKKKEFYFENDVNHDRKIVISEAEIGYIYNNGRVEAYDGTIVAENKMHPMKACRLLKEYWDSSLSKREVSKKNEFEAQDKSWLEESLVKIMANDYEEKYGNFDILEFKKWFRRNLCDYEDMYPDLV